MDEKGSEIENGIGTEENGGVPGRRKRAFAVAGIALVHVLALAAAIRIYVGVLPFWRGSDDASNFGWVGALAMSGLGVAIVSVLVLCDDFALRRRFFDSFDGEKKTARYVVNFVCAVVCVVYAILFIAAACLGYVFFGLFYLAAIHVVDVFLAAVAALRLADLILWLYERKRKDVRK